MFQERWKLQKSPLWSSEPHAAQREFIELKYQAEKRYERTGFTLLLLLSYLPRISCILALEQDLPPSLFCLALLSKLKYLHCPLPLPFPSQENNCSRPLLVPPQGSCICSVCRYALVYLVTQTTFLTLDMMCSSLAHE